MSALTSSFTGAALQVKATRGQSKVSARCPSYGSAELERACMGWHGAILSGTDCH